MTETPDDLRWTFRLERRETVHDPVGFTEDLLGPMLDLAVRLEIERMRDWTFEQRDRIARDGALLAVHNADNLLYGGRACGESFAIIARGLAHLAYAPGGVRFRGYHWQARSVEESEAERWDEPRSIQPGMRPDPDEERIGRLLDLLGEDWVKRGVLKGQYLRLGYSAERLDWDLDTLRGRGLVEADGGRWQWRRARPKVERPRPVLAPPEVQAQITEAQLRIPQRPWVMQTCQDFRREARWQELEARRGYDSQPLTLRTAARMRWAAERRRGGLVAPFDPVLDALTDEPVEPGADEGAAP